MQHTARQLGMGSDDSPLDADYYIIDDLRHGDLIIAGTDGVWWVR